MVLLLVPTYIMNVTRAMRSDSKGCALPHIVRARRAGETGRGFILASMVTFGWRARPSCLRHINKNGVGQDVVRLTPSPKDELDHVETIFQRSCYVDHRFSTRIQERSYLTVTE